MIRLIGRRGLCAAHTAHGGGQQQRACTSLTAAASVSTTRCMLPSSLATLPCWNDNVRRFMSSTSTSTINSSAGSMLDEQRFQFNVVYVHNVSKTVLEHLQDARSEWVQEQGLDRGLRLNSNGTFVLQFPAKRGYDAGRIWTSYDGATKQHWLSLSKGKLNCRFLLKDGRGGGSNSVLPSSSSSSSHSSTTNSRHQQQQQQQQPLGIMQKKSLGIKFATVQEEQDMMEDFIRQVVDRMIATLNDAATTSKSSSNSSNSSNSSYSNNKF